MVDDISRNLATESTGETSALLYTIYINLFIFGILICSFEAFRHFKQIYLKRMKRKFQATNRVPPRPPSYFLGWLRHVYMISQEDFLHMVGLDGYMLIRFIILCFKLSCFVTFWGVTILAPLYYHAQGGTLSEWNGYTLANVVDGYGGVKLWLPAIFSYLYLAYACHLFYSEYRHFVLKRLEYLIQGDPDTNPQTHYTVMIENVPVGLQSGPALKDFFEKLFPGNVYSCEVMLELKQLESICEHRSNTRNKLEKAIAIFNSTSKRSTITISKSYFLQIKEDLEKLISKININSVLQVIEQGDIDKSPNGNSNSNINNNSNSNGNNIHNEENDGRHSLSSNPNESIQYLKSVLPSNVESTENCSGCVSIDAITYYACMLDKENEVVRQLQEEFSRKTEEIAAAESEKIKQQYADTRSGTFIAYIQEKSAAGIENAKNDIAKRISLPFTSKKNKKSGSWLSDLQAPLWSPEHSDETPPQLSPINSPEIKNSQELSKTQENLEKSLGPEIMEKGMKGAKAILFTGKQIVGDAATVAGSSLNEFANEGVRTARIAGRGAIRSILEATRTLELLTLGAYYSTSSTAFVTFKSRVAKSVAYQMLLSHENYQMVVTSAPNAKDIRWENVSIPLPQINARHQIAGMTFGILAIFWSAVVALIKAYSSLDDLSENYKWLEEYQNSLVYKLLNEYLAVVVLLILLALLPFVFDFVARFYEGLKCESEIQDVIMTRYFYYQLANVYVTVTAGTIFGSIHDIIQHPGNILTILGKSLPQVSIYFANMLVVKILTGVPVEMLRIWQLLTVLGVRSFFDKNKFTRRELRTGVFMDYPMEYGWVYPNLLMVLMILTIYMCIAPLLMPCAVIYFAFAYAMYKYQLLYVFVNDYQSGGNMWYQVFNRSMIILICASLVLWGYLGLKRTYHLGPFYMMIPQPFLLYYFWGFCNKKFTTPSIAMSLECAVEMDGLNSGLKNLNKQTPVDLFDPKLYRQKALIVEDLVPERYRNYTHDEIVSSTTSPIISSHPVNSSGSNLGFNSPPPPASSSAPSALSATATAGGDSPVIHPNLIISPSFKKDTKSRQESIEGVTMTDINNYYRAPSFVGRQTFDENSPTTYRAASVDQERELSIAMEKYDNDNLEDQIDELLAPTKPSKTFSDIRSSTTKLLAEEAPTYGTLNERKSSFVIHHDKK